MFYSLFPTFFFLFLMKGLCLVPLRMEMNLTTRCLTRLVMVEKQSLVLCYLDTKVCSSAAISQVALIIVAFVFNQSRSLARLHILAVPIRYHFITTTYTGRKWHSTISKWEAMHQSLYKILLLKDVSS